MLQVLRQIVQEVNEAQDLNEVLRTMVHRVSETINVEACSVYLADRRNNHYLLVNSVGFLPDVDGKVSIKFNEGIVGLVGEREEPINLSDAKLHPRYRYFPETGEEKYRAFLGVPIIHQRKLVGILVVQQPEPRRFDEGEEAFLVTISAQLAGYIAHAQTAGMIGGIYNEEELSTTLNGISAAPGVGIGQAVGVYLHAELEAVPDRKITDIEQEIVSFNKALLQTRKDIQNLKHRLKKSLLPEEQTLFEAYIKIIDSSSIYNSIVDIIKKGHWAPFAIRKVIKRQIHKFEAMEDPYLRERATDILDLGRRVLVNFYQDNKKVFNYPDHTILIGDEVTASALAEVPREKLAAIVSKKGSTNSHVAILAKAMGIPCVMGVTGLPTTKLENKRMIVDGYNGEVYTSPTSAMVAEFSRLAKEEQELYAGLDQLQHLPAKTPDDFLVPLYVNTGLVADIQPALKNGAEGIGLYRTEVPFMIRDRFPGEEEQFHIYRQILEKFAPRPVTVRTLDAGGDKCLPYFPIKEDNPYLGWRGIRITLDHPEIFLVQLRAMLRASAELNNLKVLFPMVSSLAELDEALRFLNQAYRELKDEGYNIAYPKTGVMIEVPATVYQAEKIAQRVDFLSVGSNDLTQYMLAVDRNNAQVANMYDDLHPAVLQALKLIVTAGHKQGKQVTICGEMASEPIAVIALLGLGFDMLSMSAHALPRVKWIIRNFSVARAKILLEEVLHMDNPQDIRLHLEGALEEAGLGGLVRAGK